MSSLQKQTVATWTEALERMEAQVPEVKRPDSEAACVRVSEFAKSARGFRLRIETVRKESIGPHQDIVKQINAQCRPLTERAKQVEVAHKILIGDYREEQQIKERAEAAERRKEAERLEAEALKAAEADDNVGFESDAQRAEDLRVEAAAAEKLAERKSTPAQAGTARSTVSYRYEPEVVDDTKIPRIYLKPDMVMIRSMRSQKPAPPEIPGIRWKKIPNVSVR